MTGQLHNGHKEMTASQQTLTSAVYRKIRLYKENDEKSLSLVEISTGAHVRARHYSIPKGDFKLYAPAITLTQMCVTKIAI